MKKTATIMRKVSKSAKNEEGYLLIMSFFVLIILMIMGVTLAVMGMQEFNLSSRAELMNQAYNIADAGVNSAAVTLENNPSYEQALTPVYPGDNGSSITTETSTIPGAAGSFTYSVYQSDLNTTDPTYKVIKSTGSITSQGKTVDRTILARVIIGATGTSDVNPFNYLMYNGMDSNGDGKSEGGTWNQPLSGSAEFDGADAYLNDSPLGAIYVDGNMFVPTSLSGSMTIDGRIVATGNVTLQNSGGTTSGNSIKVRGNTIIPGSVSVPGNVIAGLGGTGSATVQANAPSGAINISGDVCAANNVTVTNTNTGNLSSNLVIGGIVAGDTATIKATASMGAPLQVTADGIVAGNYADIESKWFTGAPGITINGNISANGLSNLAIWSGSGGVDLLIANNSSASSITTGGICSNGRVNLKALYQSSSRNAATFGITTGSIDVGYSSGDTGVGTGVYGVYGEIDSQRSGHESYLTVGGQINSAGSVYFQTKSANGSTGRSANCPINLQGINAGENSSGVGVYWGVLSNSTDAFCNVNAANIVSVGDITVNDTSGSRFNVGSLWSGGNISLNPTPTSSWTNIKDDSIYTNGPISAHGSFNANAAGNIDLYKGDINVVQDINLISTDPWDDDDAWPARDIQSPCQIRAAITSSGNTNYTIYVGGSLETYNYVDGHIYTGIDTSAQIGNIMAVGNITVLNKDRVTMGNCYTGNSSNPNSRFYLYTNNNYVSGGAASYTGNVWASGQVDVFRQGNDLITDPGTAEFQGWSGDLHMGWIKSATNIKMEENSYDAGVDVWTQGMTAPSITTNTSWGVSGSKTFSNPGRPSVTAPVVTTPSTPAKPAAPTVGSGGNVDLYAKAGLTALVELSKPNWYYYETVASPRAPLYQNGTWTCPIDHTTHPCINFTWNSTTPYSSNEVVYNDDPTVDLCINVLNWSNQNAAFTGTIVSEGSIYITAGNSDWVLAAGQNLNIVSGYDINNYTTGFAQTDAQLHLWAQHDIILNSITTNLGTGHTFYGSFTAGDQVQYNSNETWNNMNFKWSRWALVPSAWTPPFQVLDWREI